MRPYDAAYIEFPKWVGGVLVHSAAEEREATAATPEVEDTEVLAAAEVMPPKAALLEPEPARLASSTVAMLEPPARTPLSGRERMQRMRERQRNGRRAIMLDITAAQVEALVMAGVLDASKRDDAVEVALGVGRSLDGMP